MTTPAKRPARKPTPDAEAVELLGFDPHTPEGQIKAAEMSARLAAFLNPPAVPPEPPPTRDALRASLADWLTTARGVIRALWADAEEMRDELGDASSPLADFLVVSDMGGLVIALWETGELIARIDFRPDSKPFTIADPVGVARRLRAPKAAAGHDFRPSAART